MNNSKKSSAEQETDESKRQAMKEAAAGKENDNQVIHTINPFTGTEVTITPEDLEGIEKKIEADTERD